MRHNIRNSASIFSDFPKSYTLAVVMLNIESTLDSLRQLTCIGHDELFNYELITDSIRHPCDPSELSTSGLLACWSAFVCIRHLSTKQRGDNSMGLHKIFPEDPVSRLYGPIYIEIKLD